MTSELMQKELTKAQAILPDPLVRFIDECRAKPHPESYLIAVLHQVQDHFGYLAQEHMDAVSTLMQIPAAKVTGVASFYHFFNFTPRAANHATVSHAENFENGESSAGPPRG